MSIALPSPSRRLLMGAVLLAPAMARAAPRGLTFAVFRNGSRIGEHRMSFAGREGELTATSEVEMVIRLGPVPVYRYRHHAAERWSGGRFQSLATTTSANGKRMAVAAERSDGGVAIDGAAGRVQAPAGAAPLTHWNPKAFDGPLFNPQEGKLLKVTARAVGARHYAVRGETQIDDWYDEAGAWSALRGKLPDGSTIEYRAI